MNTPYFIFYPKILENNYNYFEKLCKKHLKKFIIAYSIKTNSFKGVIEKLNYLESNFDVSSLNEIKMAMKFSNKKFIFNSPCKKNKELKMAIKNNFLINVDSYSEINKIIKMLNGDNFNIGLRISLEESKFGFGENKISELINYCKLNNIRVVCLHFHCGTQITIKKFKENLEKIEKLLSRIRNKELKYLDVGGGFPDKFQLKNLNCSLEDYFVLISKLNKFNLKIVVEPGRFLVADSFELIAKVNTIKQNFGKNYAVLDAGINVLSKITLSNYKFSKINLSNNYAKNKNIKKDYIFAGPLLFNNDILGRFFGDLNDGDLIRIENVGAYCYNLAWEISYKKPGILTV